MQGALSEDRQLDVLQIPDTIWRGSHAPKPPWPQDRFWLARGLTDLVLNLCPTLFPFSSVSLSCFQSQNVVHFLFERYCVIHSDTAFFYFCFYFLQSLFSYFPSFFSLSFLLFECFSFLLLLVLLALFIGCFVAALGWWFFHSPISSFFYLFSYSLSITLNNAPSITVSRPRFSFILSHHTCSRSLSRSIFFCVLFSIPITVSGNVSSSCCRFFCASCCLSLFF